MKIALFAREYWKEPFAFCTKYVLHATVIYRAISSIYPALQRQSAHLSHKFKGLSEYCYCIKEERPCLLFLFMSYMFQTIWNAGLWNFTFFSIVKSDYINCNCKTWFYSVLAWNPTLSHYNISLSCWKYSFHKEATSMHPYLGGPLSLFCLFRGVKRKVWALNSPWSDTQRDSQFQKERPQLLGEALAGWIFPC